MGNSLADILRRLPGYDRFSLQVQTLVQVPEVALPHLRVQRVFGAPAIPRETPSACLECLGCRQRRVRGSQVGHTMGSDVEYCK